MSLLRSYSEMSFNHTLKYEPYCEMLNRQFYSILTHTTLSSSFFRPKGFSVARANNNCYHISSFQEKRGMRYVASHPSVRACVYFGCMMRGCV